MTFQSSTDILLLQPNSHKGRQALQSTSQATARQKSSSIRLFEGQWNYRRKLQRNLNEPEKCALYKYDHSGIILAHSSEQRINGDLSFGPPCDFLVRSAAIGSLSLVGPIRTCSSGSQSNLVFLNSTFTYIHQAGPTKKRARRIRFGILKPFRGTHSSWRASPCWAS